MKKLILFFVSWLMVPAIQAQPVEVLLGYRYTYYQHSLSKQFTDRSRFGITHIASAIMRYESQASETGQLPNELMNQVYLRYRVLERVSVIAGSFFNTAVGLRPSAGINWARRKDDSHIFLQGRMDIWNKPSFELFGLFSFQPRLTATARLYTRLQFMTNVSSICQHNRSYQQLRLGIEHRGVQFGLGFQLDQYGPRWKTHPNAGVFIQKAMF